MKTQSRARNKLRTITTLAMTAVIVSALNISCAAIQTQERTILFDESCDSTCVEVMRGAMNTWNLQAGTDLTERLIYSEVRVYVADYCGPDAGGWYTPHAFGSDNICIDRDCLAGGRCRGIAIHELGHSMGLIGHLSDVGHIMSVKPRGDCLDGADIAYFCSVFNCSERQFACAR